MVKKPSDLAPDYDPLSYIVTEAHRRGLQVHIWFVVGHIGAPHEEPGSVLARHPEWAMLDASGGPQIHWPNFVHSDARQLMSDGLLDPA